ncbi:hypothetical protein FRB94_009824 [Tulasnella sp. JGI-2019a]|nr:hypothetical protein FRB94_009824 [Tulasnella sp. JGI-2019a]
MDVVLKVVYGLPAYIQDQLAFISTDPLPWKESVLGFSWFVYLFESYLTARQFSMYKISAPPPELVEHFPSDKFLKGQKYGAAKARFSIVSGFINQIIETAFIHFDIYAMTWALAGSILQRFGFHGNYEISQSLIWGTLLFLCSSIPTIPLSYYQTFVLEEEYGFNKTTRGLFFADLIKGWGLGATFGLPFLAAFLWIIKKAGDSFIPYLMGFIVSMQLIFVVIYPLLIQPLFNKLSPLPEGTLRTRIEGLAGGLHFPLKHLYVIDGSKRSSHSNAYFYGLPWSKHIVIFDTLIQKTPEDQIEAVLAHELGHWQYSHPSKLLLISQVHLYAMLSVFPPFLRSSPLLRSFNFPPSVAAVPPTMVAFMLFQLVQGPIDTIIRVGMNAISRRFEFQADQFACEFDEKTPVEGEVKEALMGDRLGKALISLHVGNLSTVWVDWLYSTWHFSHPTLMERLKAMKDIKSGQASKRLLAEKKEL